MVDTTLIPAIRAAVAYNELGSANPYVLSYALIGSSGPSFGVFQADLSSNLNARSVFEQCMVGTDTDVMNQLKKALYRPCPNGNPLDSQQTLMVSTNLATDRSKSLIDGIDDRSFTIILDHLDELTTAAGQTSIDPRALLYMALWVNMTGAPNQMCNWVKGETVSGVAPPAGSSVTEDDVTAYLKAQSFFRIHPRNFLHMTDSVNHGAAIIPPVSDVSTC